jgi:hypothetical protein
MHDQQMNIKPENINPGNPLNICVHRENQVEVWLNVPLPSFLVERWEKRSRPRKVDCVSSIVTLLSFFEAIPSLLSRCVLP